MSAETSPIFDNLPQGSKITPDELHQKFDGTLPRGTDALQVEFDESGKVTKINTVNVFDGRESLPIIPKEGGYRWIMGNYADETELGQRVNAVIEAASEDWKRWKETEADHPNISFREWKSNMIWTGQVYSGSMQRHHDYYMKLQLERELTRDEQLEYNLAKAREEAGEVKSYNPVRPPRRARDIILDGREE